VESAASSACGSTRARKRADQKVLGEIFEGFSDRFDATLKILIRVRLETPTTLEEQFRKEIWICTGP
jgi:hypothetical protein